VPEVIEYDHSEARGAQPECGVFAVHAPSDEWAVGQVAVEGIELLQNRGRDAAGVAIFGFEEETSDVDTGPVPAEPIPTETAPTLASMLVKAPGLVPSVFPDKGESLDKAIPRGHAAMGQVRYSTYGDESGIQPQERDGFKFEHNGELTNILQVVEEYGVAVPEGASDSYLAADCIEVELKRNGGDLAKAVRTVCSMLEGGFGIVVSDGETTIGVRDPSGLKPLSVAQWHDGPFTIASEDRALGVNLTWTRGDLRPGLKKEIGPGQMVILDGQRIEWSSLDVGEIEPKLCPLEWVYFAHPDTELSQNTESGPKPVWSVREALGRDLALEEKEAMRLGREDPNAYYKDGIRHIKPDMILSIPRSSKPSADGIAEVMEVPHLDDVILKEDGTRVFILPTQKERDQAAEQIFYLNPERKEVLRDAVVYVDDDSLVRGTNAKAIIALLWEAGVKAIHLRIPSPPIIKGCFYGVHIRQPLIADGKTVQEIAEDLGVDSLRYGTKKGLAQAIGVPLGQLCMGCMDGDYHIAVPDQDIAA
jgi:amidophosphoribosyltransferase